MPYSILSYISLRLINPAIIILSSLPGLQVDPLYSTIYLSSDETALWVQSFHFTAPCFRFSAQAFRMQRACQFPYLLCAFKLTEFVSMHIYYIYHVIECYSEEYLNFQHLERTISLKHIQRSSNQKRLQNNRIF
jgi:hypothetical protein